MKLTDAEAKRIAAIIGQAWDEADHLSGMYNGDFKWAINRLAGSVAPPPTAGCGEPVWPDDPEAQAVLPPVFPRIPKPSAT